MFWRVHRSSQFPARQIIYLKKREYFQETRLTGTGIEPRATYYRKRECIMRIRTLAAIGLMGMGLSGCSLWNKSDRTANQTVHSDANLRTTPQQAYKFADQAYDVNIHNAGATSSYSNSSYANTGYSTGVPNYSSPSKYAGYRVELYDTRSSDVTSAFTDPRQTEFVSLNGESETADWQNCETRNRGYLFMSEFDFMLDPGFEVCMRNKGYVLTTEYNAGSKHTLNAQTAGLRGSFPSPSHSSSYPAFFP